jgi:hypothetical protein
MTDAEFQRAELQEAIDALTQTMVTLINIEPNLERAKTIITINGIETPGSRGAVLASIVSNIMVEISVLRNRIQSVNAELERWQENL